MNRKTLAQLVLLAAAFVFLPGYNGCEPVLQNNGFDLWCGDSLCYWQVEKGSVDRVPTWHNGDYGVELKGDDAAISQLRDISASDIQCLRFDLVAKIEETADVTLELDFYGDGTVDVSKPIPASDWAKVSYLLPMPPSYEGILFRVHKRGSGKVVLAQIYAEESTDCTGAGPMLTSRPLGASCDDGSQCASATCAPEFADPNAPMSCSACTDDSDCTAGQACGAEFGATHLDQYRACGAAARHGLGERCVGDSECGTGICESGSCSACRDGDTCASGATCARSERQGTDAELTFWWARPYQCGPDAGGALSGDPCLIDGDCASGSCNGAGDLGVCEIDGRPCAMDTDCPDGLACRTIGTTGGTCQ